MAIITRYVNTASTAGSQDGTTSSAGNSGTAAYESLDKWNTSEAANLTTGGDTHIVNCSGSAADTVGDVQMTGWTTDAGDFITVNGEVSAGAYSTSKYRLEYTMTGNYQQGISCQESYTVFNDLQLQITNDGSKRADGIKVESGASQVFFNRIIVRGILTSDLTNSHGLFMIDSDTPGDIRACLVMDYSGSSTTRNFRSDGVTVNNFFNITSDNGQIYSSGNDTISRNCAASNPPSEGFGWVRTATSAYDAACSHNQSEDTNDAPGGNSQVGVPTYVNEGADDFRPASGDTVLKGNGVDLSGEFDFDLTNTSWGGTWSIGCLIPAVAAAGGGVPLSLIYRNQMRHLLNR